MRDTPGNYTHPLATIAIIAAGMAALALISLPAFYVLLLIARTL